LVEDITYGLLTLLYLCMMLYLAWRLSDFDVGGKDARAIRSDVRTHILAKLKGDTHEGRQLSPDWQQFLARVDNEVDIILVNGQASASTTLNDDQKRRIAREHIQFIRRQFPNLDPRGGAAEEQPKGPFRPSFLTNIKWGSGNRAVSAPTQVASDPTIGNTVRHVDRSVSNPNMRAPTFLDPQQYVGVSRAPSGRSGFSYASGGSGSLAPPPGIPRMMSQRSSSGGSVASGSGRRQAPPGGYPARGPYMQAHVEDDDENGPY
jgi:hypothetical protein